MGMVAGLIVEKVIKSRSLSLVGNAVIGMIGFNIGFYGGLLLTSDYRMCLAPKKSFVRSRFWSMKDCRIAICAI